MTTAIYEFFVRSSHLLQNASILWGFRTWFEMTEGTSFTMCFFLFYFSIKPFPITLPFACHNDGFEIKQEDGNDAFPGIM